jgi:hydroxyacylglutathione hydrolase
LELAGEGSVFRIPGMGFVNSYLVKLDEERFALIDTGTPSGGKKVLSYLLSLGKETNSIAYIVLTHSDSDHSGSAASLRSATGAPIAIHELDAPRVSGNKKLKEVQGAASVLFDFIGILTRMERFVPDILLKDGDRLANMTVVHTPGHTQGSICLLVPGEALFTGDTLRTDKEGRIGFPPQILNWNTEQLKRSVTRLSTLKFSKLYPGHGSPILDGASEQLSRFLRENV